MKSLTMKELYQHYKTGISKEEVVLDVREPDEYAEGHIPGSLNVPLGDVMGHANHLKQFKAIYIHCLAGRRAQQAMKTLHAMGFSNLACIADGGFPEWEAAGYPVERG